MQAAIGLAQLDKLPKFIRARKANYQSIIKGLIKYDKYFLFMDVEKELIPVGLGFRLSYAMGRHLLGWSFVE